jgi:hypothetical protein
MQEENAMQTLSKKYPLNQFGLWVMIVRGKFSGDYPPFA